MYQVGLYSLSKSYKKSNLDLSFDVIKMDKVLSLT